MVSDVKRIKTFIVLGFLRGKIDRGRKRQGGGATYHIPMPASHEAPAPVPSFLANFP